MFYPKTGDQVLWVWSFRDTPYLVVTHEKDGLISEGPKVFRSHVPGSGDGDQICISFIDSIRVAVAFICALPDCRSYRHRFERMCVLWIHLCELGT